MVDDAALRRAFSEYAEALLRRYEIGNVLYRLTDQVVEVLALDGAGVAIGMTRDELQFVTATDQRVARVESAQISAGDGPSFEAYGSGDAVAIPDVATAQRWPEYRAALAAEGFRAVAAVPMPVDERRIGVLSMYVRTARAWPEDELDVAQLLANIASGYVLNARNLDQQSTLAEQLQQALDSRVLIEQAKGILAERHHIDVSEAFERLRQHARSSNTRLHEVSRQVVARELEL